ncbi:MAG: peptidoglycan DD-metalloendopeptidase family protein [Clostridia bacterium]|nr:peptidoglycan DD-metalloendopeptidase family protein [Clostridia bacterium]
MVGRDDVKRWFEQFYLFCFTVGVRSIRCLRAIRRFTRLLWVPFVRAAYRALDWLILRHWRTAVEECRQIREDFRKTKRYVQETPRERRGQALLRFLMLPVLAVRRHKKTVRTVLNYGLPVCGVAVLFLTVQFWQGAQFALALEYNGKPIGYIADEGVYADAATIVRSAVINADDSFTVEQAPTMNLTLIEGDMVLPEQEVGERILKSLSGELVQASGFYVDGIFYGALPEEKTLQSLIDSVLSRHKTDSVDGVGFFAQTQIVNGLYPLSALVEEQTMSTRLQALTVKTMRNIEYTETIKYKTVYKEVTDQPLGFESVQQKGKNGTQKVYAQEIMVNGKKQYQTVLRVEVMQPSTDQIVLVGAQKYDGDTVLGDGVATGTFIWPLPYTKTISSPFASRWGSFHGAIDIANGSTHGKPIIASDGGTVIEAQYHGSWGYYVLIDHGNGFKTRYAHCSKLEVEAGDKVAQGQYIAKVGNTGYSFGSHLHFEVIKNGVLVNPLDYVQR